MHHPGAAATPCQICLKQKAKTNVSTLWTLEQITCTRIHVSNKIATTAIKVRVKCTCMRVKKVSTPHELPKVDSANIVFFAAWKLLRQRHQLMHYRALTCYHTMCIEPCIRQNNGRPENGMNNDARTENTARAACRNHAADDAPLGATITTNRLGIR